MTDTLTRFREAFDAIKELWPDAPRLPSEIVVGYDPPRSFDTANAMVCMECSDGTVVALSSYIAEAVCIRHAAEIGAWWSSRGYAENSKERTWSISAFCGKWHAEVVDWDNHVLFTWDDIGHEGHFEDQVSAHLAALNAIVKWERERRSDLSHAAD